MILETIFSFFASGIIKIISLVNVGHLSTQIMTKFYNVIDFIFENLTLLGLFIRPASLVSVSVLMLAIINFEKIYGVAVWIKRKIKP